MVLVANIGLNLLLIPRWGRAWVPQSSGQSVGIPGRAEGPSTGKIVLAALPTRVRLVNHLMENWVASLVGRGRA